MEIVVSHEGTDFDSLASMHAVSRLYPGTVPVLGGSINRNVRYFLSLYGHFMHIVQEKDLDWEEVTHVTAVDTAILNRLGKSGEYIQKKGIPYRIFDHHPVSPDNVRGENVIIEPYGACSTILSRMIRERDLPLSPLEATLLVLGIYEDTGSFTFPTTTPEDLEAASYLVSRGARVRYVPRFAGMQLTKEQRQILREMIQSLTVEDVNGIPIHFTMVQADEYVDGVSFLVHKLMDLEEVEVLFAIFALEDKVYIISRSRLQEVDLRRIMNGLNGGGHQSAASTSLKNTTPQEVREKVLHLLRKNISLADARQIMSHPVKTVHADTPIREASLMMLRFGFSGLPVVNVEGRVVGLIARRDVEKAVHHGLEHAPVKSFMSPQVVSVSPHESVFRVRNLMVEKDIGRIPVVKGETLLGIITRSDILRTFHQQENFLLPRMKHINLSEKIFRHFKQPDLETLQLVGETAHRIGIPCYLVGGVVRDIILGFPNDDFDIVVEGNAIDFSSRLQETIGGKIVSYPPFGTSLLFLPDGRRLDLATARQEFYSHPGAPPQIEHSTLRRDLFRRDFTINAMAISLNPEDWGHLIDFFGGLGDLEKGYIRVLHPLSLVEDPARTIRAIRFEQKYNFHIEPFTMSLLKQAVGEELPAKIKPDRLKEELGLIMRQPGHHRYLSRFYQLELFPLLFPGCIWKSEYGKIYDTLRKTLTHFPPPESLDELLLQLAPLFDDLRPMMLSSFADRLALSRKTVQKISAYLRERYHLLRLLDEAVKPSQVVKVLNRISLEFVYLAYAKIHQADQTESTEKIERYLSEWRTQRPETDGHDLKRMGIKEGPVYATILNELKTAKLDGLVRNKADEQRFIDEILERKR